MSFVEVKSRLQEQSALDLRSICGAEKAKFAN